MQCVQIIPSHRHHTLAAPIPAAVTASIALPAGIGAGVGGVVLLLLLIVLVVVLLRRRRQNQEKRDPFRHATPKSGSLPLCNTRM